MMKIKVILVFKAIVSIILLSGCELKYSEDELMDNIKSKMPIEYNYKNLDFTFIDINSVEIDSKSNIIRLSFKTKGYLELNIINYKKSFECENMSISFTPDLIQTELIIKDTQMDSMGCVKIFPKIRKAINYFISDEINITELLGVKHKNISDVYNEKDNLIVKVNIFQ